MNNAKPTVKFDLPSFRARLRNPCVFEKMLSDHIQEKISEERLRYDAALVRANDMLLQTRKLKEQVRTLAADFGVLESEFQTVTLLNTRFKRAARERFHYLENQDYLAALIATLMAQHRDGGASVGRGCYSPCDWARLRIAPPSPFSVSSALFACPAEGALPGKRMSLDKRRLLQKMMWSKGIRSH